MCKIGDIILIDKYITEDGVLMSKHSFVVIQDEQGSIQGLDYDIVTNVMSTIKDERHKQKN